MPKLRPKTKPSPGTRGKIKLLDEAVVHRIAAGEVVDRPSSVLKELVENSIDAGASSVKVLVVGGGIERIEVDDDGKGMGRVDLELCLKRHATSKITGLEDLDAVVSLGFRGEALAAISSVARVEIQSREKSSTESWSLRSSSDGEKLQPTNRKKGTKVIVADLFYNTPARKKFLKAPGSEANACSQVLWELAMSHPELAFAWHVVDSKGEVKEQVERPPERASERFLASLGENIELIEVFSRRPAPEIKSLKVLAARAPVSFRNQKNIHLFINGRWVSDKRLSYALREAYSGLIETGCFPAAWLDVEVDPSVVDVNIHPQKKEVRWPKGFSLGSVAYHALRPHLEVKSSLGSSLFSQGAEGAQDLESLLSPSMKGLERSLELAMGPSLAEDFEREVDERETQLFPPQNVELSDEVSSHMEVSSGVKPEFKFRDLRVVGEVGASWLVMESPKGIVLIDQHAAHERVRFEEILTSSKVLSSKPLLLPLELKLPMAVCDYQSEVIEALEQLGFEVSESKMAENDLVEIIAVPESERKLDWEKLFADIFERVEDHLGAEALRVQVEARIASSLACHGSVRRGQRLSHEEIKALMKQLDDVEWGAFCPHGRPVWKLMTHQSLEDLFHR